MSSGFLGSGLSSEESELSEEEEEELELELESDSESLTAGAEELVATGAVGSADELRTDSRFGPATNPDRVGLLLLAAPPGACGSDSTRGREPVVSDFLTFPFAFDLVGAALMESGTTEKLEAGGGQFPILFCLRAEVHSSRSKVISPELWFQTSTKSF